MDKILKPVFLEEPELLLHPKLMCEQYKNLLVEIQNEQFGFWFSYTYNCLLEIW